MFLKGVTEQRGNSLSHLEKKTDGVLNIQISNHTLGPGNKISHTFSETEKQNHLLKQYTKNHKLTRKGSLT